MKKINCHNKFSNCEQNVKRYTSYYPRRRVFVDLVSLTKSIGVTYQLGQSKAVKVMNEPLQANQPVFLACLQ